jgi:cation:H+ antiporter
MFLTYALFAVGIYLLIQGADYLVQGASSVAKRFGVPALVIGLTVVAFGTSMPELVVSLIAAVQGSGDISFGNIAGSNMANILLILGVAAVITTLKVQRSTIWKEIPFSFLAALALLVIALAPVLDGAAPAIYRSQGILLLLFFAIFIYYTVELARGHKDQLEDKEMVVKKHSMPTALAMILGGVIALYFGGDWVVDGAVAVARQFGLSEILISSTIVAVGTSLPELVTSVAAARRKDADIAVGNVVGSNIFNIFWILGLSAAITPITLPASAVIDMLFVLLATVLLFAFMFFGKRHQLERWQGVLFLATYAAYLGFLIWRG